MTIRAYHVYTNYDHYDNWGVLVFAESPTKARAMCVDYYGGGEPYIDLRAQRLKHMDGHPLTPSEPCVMDGGNSKPNERELVKFSFIYRCRACGTEYRDYGCCDCQEVARCGELVAKRHDGPNAFNEENLAARRGLDWAPDRAEIRNPTRWRHA